MNKDMVEALGFTLPETLTWDFVWEVSEAAAATLGADGVYGANGQEVLIPFIYKSTDNMMIQMLQQLGAGYSNASGEIQLFKRHHHRPAAGHCQPRRQRGLLHL